MTLMIAVYVYASLVVAILGRRSRLGFWRSLALSLLVTPLLAAIAIFLFSPARFNKLPESARKRLLP